MLTIIYNIYIIVLTILACYFTKVEMVFPQHYDANGKPVTWYVYFRNEQQMLSRSLTFWPDYAIDDTLRICGSDMPWGEWTFMYLPAIVR